MYRRVMPPPPARHLQRQPAVRRGLTARARLMPDNSLASPQRLLFGQKRPAGEPARYSKLGYPSSPGLSSAPPVNVRGAISHSPATRGSGASRASVSVLSTPTKRRIVDSL